MKFSARWLVVVSSPLFSASVLAADFNPQDSVELQQALTSAASSSENDRIVLDPGVTYQTEGQAFTYTGVYGGNLTIESASPDTLSTLDGGGVTQALVLSEANGGTNTTFTLKNLTISNGMGSGDSRNGAGLQVSGAHVVVENSEFRDNTGDGLYTAAAIYAAGGREYELTINDSVIQNNQSSPSSNSTVIYAYQVKNLHITGGTRVLHNTGDRGVLKLDDTPTLIDNGTRFEGNQSKYGGNIYPDSSVASVVRIRNSEFISNSITENFGAGVLGNGKYQIDSSTFRDNSAPHWSVVRLDGASDAYITNSRFIDNQSANAGVIQLNGDGPVLSNLLFQGNQGSSTTEGIVSCANSCQILNSIFTGNVGAPLVFANYNLFEQTVVANSVVMDASTPVLGFDDSDAKASLLNNYLAPGALSTVPLAQVYQSGNITDGSDPGLDTANDYSLMQDSVLIDRGTTDASQVSLATTDIRDNARVAGNSVDIGWEEYGSSDTVPIISNFELLTTGASNLDLLQFSVEYDARGFPSPLIEFYADETGEFAPVSPEFGVFENVLFEAGPQTVTVRVTGAGGQFAEQDLVVALEELSTSEVIARVDQDVRQLCSEAPDECGIDTDAIRQEGFDSGVAQTEEGCIASPESCGIELQQYIEQGRSECQDDPAACGIDVSQGDFDEQLIPSMGEGWELFGTGQSITDLNTVFGRDVQVVWARINGEWQAWSPHRDTAEVLRDNQIAEIQAIPAHAGFWVRK